MHDGTREEHGPSDAEGTVRMDGKEGLPMFSGRHLSTLKHDGDAVIVRGMMAVDEPLNSFGYGTVLPRQVCEHRNGNDCSRSYVVSSPDGKHEKEG